MPIRQKVFAIIISLSILLGIIELVRRRKLQEEYCFLWLITGFGLLLLTLWYGLLVRITQFIGAVMPTTTLFLFGIIFLMLVGLHSSLKISSLSTQVRTLAQELSLLKNTQNNRQNLKSEADRKKT